ncbi:phosphotriesterase [Cohnella xylanilytica]|uniref:Phosphotriesterase-related protein n=1 Tax=Cohnella xylanilytica TaxID=557555 RepID=A0A841U749_9BACL|nr:hypothetical protein [Cohnella xylanilytica]MBB6693841.1 hypothetical protein [Cohnella xylanilytica]GIO14113.1 phosphotriesterase [Cohnella xylanilytica]
MERKTRAGADAGRAIGGAGRTGDGAGKASKSAEGGFIRTVRGDIPPEKLGFCHSHEHLFLAPGHPQTVNADLRIDDYELTLRELREFRDAGGRAVVDAQPLGCGRMEAELALVSAEADVHAVASTGFHKLAFYPPDHWIRRLGEEELTRLFVGELEEGMLAGTDRLEPEAASRVDARAGLIKTAVDAERMADPDKRWFAAAAGASLATGAPIMCHTESPEQARWLFGFYRERGVPAEAIILCHLDRKLDDPKAHLELAGEGAYLEYDTIGRYKYHSDEAEAEWIARMLAAGLEDRLLLGLDTTRARLAAYGGTPGLTHLAERFLPLLARAGADEAQLRKLMRRNPARAFAFRS